MEKEEEEDKEVEKLVAVVGGSQREGGKVKGREGEEGRRIKKKV